MRVTSNTKLIKRRSKLGMIVSLAGIGVLAVGMAASFRPQIAWVSLVALIIGFVLAQFGSYNLRRWGRSPRPDQVLEEAMKGFDDRYHFYAWTLPVPYVLLSPQGLYTFITRDQTGKVSSDGKTWRAKPSLSRLFLLFAQEGLGNPTEEARLQAAKLTEWLRTKLPDLTVSVQPAVVFIDPRVELDVTDAPVPVLEPKGIKKWLRGGGKGDAVRPADLRTLEALFDEIAAA
ncbi:MAG: hypothetical protein BWY52_00788 [Chloroflexi bacterium ADurb.Bin325]|nr:MAG: hypothetical protein BWY52_00788 [Chloroflexi bacterium ADurb.Bin325]